MNSQLLIERNKQFAIEIIGFCKELPKSYETQVMAKQLLRSATSVAANYRAACRARSTAEFLAKISIVVEEIDESNFWLDLLKDSKLVENQNVDLLLNESLELLKSYSRTRKTAKDNNR